MADRAGGASWPLVWLGAGMPPRGPRPRQRTGLAPVRRGAVRRGGAAKRDGAGGQHMNRRVRGPGSRRHAPCEGGAAGGKHCRDRPGTRQAVRRPAGTPRWRSPADPACGGWADRRRARRAERPAAHRAGDGLPLVPRVLRAARRAVGRARDEEGAHSEVGVHGMPPGRRRRGPGAVGQRGDALRRLGSAMVERMTRSGRRVHRPIGAVRPAGRASGEAGAGGEGRGGGAARQGELEQDIGCLPLYRVLAHPEVRGDGRVAQPPRHQPQHLALARA